MGKLSRTSTTARTPRPRGVIRTNSTSKPDTRNHGGRAAWSRDIKGELFTLAVSNFVGEDTFYEKAGERDERFRQLIAQATVEDPIWTAQLLKWLRAEGNMRSASIVGAIEYGRAWNARFDTDPSYGTRGAAAPRQVLNSVLQRADEPGEALGYWLGQYGRPLPKWFKKGLGDAAARLYTPFNALKYDGQGQPVRFGDVIEFSQVSNIATAKWLLDRRHGREEGVYGIEMLMARRELMALPVDSRRAMLQAKNSDSLLKAAGMTWESVSGWIQGPMDAKVWESIIPSMGYMALLRNLRNFDEAGVSDKVARKVIERLTDPERVARSRQLPFRFLSAYKAAPSDRWRHPLSVALGHSFANIPQMGGKTLVLIDKSSSMGARPISAKSSVYPWEIAALFGIALAKSQERGASIFGFDTNTVEFRPTAGANVLSEVDRFAQLVHGGATRTAEAVTKHWPGHQRVVVISDEQQNGGYYGNSRGGVFDAVPPSVPCYTINVMGYADAHNAATGVRHGLAGLNDSVFKMMSVLEARQAGRWPWEI